MRWHYICRWTASRSGLVDLAHGGRQRDAGGGERETGGGTRWRAQQEAFVVLLDLGLGERVEIGENVRPGALATEVGDARLQLLLQDEGEEAAGHVTANGLVDFVEDWPCREQALGCAEGLFHHRQLFVTEHGVKRRKVGICAQHEDAIEFGILLGFGIIDGEAILTGRCEEAAITGVADERLIALLELPFERGQDRGTTGGSPNRG